MILHAADEFHDEEGPAKLRRTGVEDLGDVRVLHHRERLPLLLEAGDDFLRVHAELDDLQRHAPPHRLLLLGHPHDAEAALADLLEELVRPDPITRFLGLQPREFALDLGRMRGVRFQKIARRVVRLQQPAHVRDEQRVIAASLRDECLALGGREIQRGVEGGLRLRASRRGRIFRRGGFGGPTGLPCGGGGGGFMGVGVFISPAHARFCDEKDHLFPVPRAGRRKRCAEKTRCPPCRKPSDQKKFFGLNFLLAPAKVRQMGSSKHPLGVEPSLGAMHSFRTREVLSAYVLKVDANRNA